MHEPAKCDYQGVREGERTGSRETHTAVFDDFFLGLPVHHGAGRRGGVEYMGRGKDEDMGGGRRSILISEPSGEKQT